MTYSEARWQAQAGQMNLGSHSCSRPNAFIPLIAILAVGSGKWEVGNQRTLCSEWSRSKQQPCLDWMLPSDPFSLSR